MDDFTGKVVLVTGAGQACGRAIAVDFGRRGARVAVNDIDDGNGGQTAAQIADAGGEATFVHADVSHEDEVAQLIDTAVATYGGLDCAVNNAGAEITGLVSDSTPENFAKIIATNLEGMRACLKHEVRAMRAGGGGSICNMSSVTSDLTGVPFNGLYAATKGGVDALTKTAAIEAARDNININALAFLAADVENGMFQRFFESQSEVTLDAVMASIPVGRALGADELCAAVRFLCSGEVRFMLGTTMVVDGGFTAQ